MKVCRIALIGGGIGGLTAALSLQRAGLEVAVFERAAELLEVGAGLVVSGPSMRGLDLFGVGDGIRSVAGERPKGYFELKHYATGDVIQEAHDVPGQDKAYAVHRADLQRLLVDAVLANDPDCLHLGHEFTGLTQDDDGVAITFANGNTVTADAAVGCDGVSSVVRPHLFGPEPVVYTGMVSFRGLIPADLVTASIRDENGSFYVGPDRMFILYFVRGTDYMNVVAHARQPGWEEEGWAIPADKSTLEELYGDFCDVVHEIIDAVPDANLFKWALRDRSPRERWTEGRVSLLGDAAHPMLPFLGQGGNMAMEDGTVLGRCFAAATDIDEAFARYEAARRERANGVQLMTRERAKVLLGFDDPDALPIRGGLQMTYDPATVPV
ncbi:MAG TPA: FAD-dependent monooxygenase [Acidimicrobiales bacterium]|nr:FAD-dependent monooxygenase [Acidimicrobiales bacterium]